MNCYRDCRKSTVGMAFWRPRVKSDHMKRRAAAGCDVGGRSYSTLTVKKCDVISRAGHPDMEPKDGAKLATGSGAHGAVHASMKWSTRIRSHWRHAERNWVAVLSWHRICWPFPDGKWPRLYTTTSHISKYRAARSGPAPSYLLNRY